MAGNVALWLIRLQVPLMFIAGWWHLKSGGKPPFPTSNVHCSLVAFEEREQSPTLTRL